MENQSLIASRKDDGGKHKKGLATLLVTVSWTKYHHRGSPRVGVPAAIWSTLVQFRMEETTVKPRTVVVPLGLEHPVCRYGQCRSGQPGASCGQTSDCVVPLGLEYPVCRDNNRYDYR
ncbi:hypothetical protein FRACYDRAFT_244194 [Fragilariopsis cylindrus CCMP1102]|uniref:Uncharacterized protein n=1 Tax=Fragilariopsis cylindrus CCMP1102 TaxID=635003 RepID=A0A1E7F432_9STRA|nr:hypothetical protein FRACYDRAFT_244194 [Fragilariopsis cylindrus CCMP1102]|eukprot:OEU12920.1 hypothetical protein FRACYDRAFT_244194 [Fragilariopsis cylindrus CCMP1102]